MKIIIVTPRYRVFPKIKNSLVVGLRVVAYVLPWIPFGQLKFKKIWPDCQSILNPTKKS